jgi:hypothetical protein
MVTLNIIIGLFALAGVFYLSMVVITYTQNAKERKLTKKLKELQEEYICNCPTDSVFIEVDEDYLERAMIEN